MDQRMNAQTFFQLVAALVGGGALASFGKWLIDYINVRSLGDEKRTAQQEGRERNIIGEYQKILDEKDRSHDAERQEWKAERRQMQKEGAFLRRVNNQLNIDNESMRMRIDALQREMVRVGGSAAMLTDMLDAVIITDWHGDIWWANEAASMYLRIPLEKLMTRNVAEFVPESLRVRHAEGMERARQRGVLPRGEIVQRAIRTRSRLNDGIEFPTEIYLNQFAVGDVMVYRAQLRRRFERPDDTEEETYVPTSASSSSSGIFPVAVVADEPGDKGRGK
jgi:PAS domain-containing protein